MKNVSAIVALLGLVSGFVVSTAGPEDLPTGTRMRVTRADGKSVTGQLTAIDDRSLMLEQQ